MRVHIQLSNRRAYSMFIYLTLSGLTLKIKFSYLWIWGYRFRYRKKSSCVHISVTFEYNSSIFHILFCTTGPIFYTRRLSLTQTFIKHLQFCHFRILSSLHFTIKFPLFVIKSICTKVSYISLSDKKNSTPSRQSFLFYTQHMQEYNVT